PAKGGGALRGDRGRPPAAGAPVSFPGGKAKGADGPFTEAEEVLGGYWMIQVKSRAEAIEWAKRAPMLDGDIIEVRQVQEISDFPPDGQKAAGRGARPDAACTISNRRWGKRYARGNNNDFPGP